MRRKRLWFAGLFLLALVLLLPFLLNLDAFRAQVHRALEQELGRKVEFASLTGRLLPRPGVLGRHVVVYERDEFGAEPFLYAERVRCDLSLSALLRFRLGFSEIHFHEPSINLVRRDDGAWNLTTFLLPGAGEVPAPSAPVISAGQGRINFKRGVDKQIYTLIDTQFTLTPRPDSHWGLSLEATPVRTDRRLAAIGRLHLNGELGPSQSFSDLPFQFQASFQDGSLMQLWALLGGEVLPVRAAVNFDGRLEGTPSNWTANGRMNLANLHRWDLVAPSQTPVWTIEFKVGYLAAEKFLQVEKLSLQTDRSHVLLGGRVLDPLGERKWNLSASGDLDLEDLLPQFAALVPDVSDRLRVQGKTEFRLALEGDPQSWTGEVNAPDDLTARVPGLPDNVRLADLQLRLRQGRLDLLPATLVFSPENSLAVQGQMDPFKPGVPLSLHWTGSDVPLAPLRRTALAFGWDLFGDTRWQGAADVDLQTAGTLLGEEPQRWQGTVKLRDAGYQVPELNNPLKLVEAQMTWKDAEITVAPLTLQLGDDTLQLRLQRKSRLARWEADLKADRVNLDALDEMINPSRQGLLARLVELRPRTEAGWQQLDAVIALHVGALEAGPFQLQGLEAQAGFQNGFLELTQLRFRAYQGRFTGRFQGDFRNSPPGYRLSGNLKQADLQQLLAGTTELGELFTGSLGADLALETQGYSPRELLRNLQGRVVGVLHDGTINHINLVSAMTATVAPAPASAGDKPEPTPLQSLAGEFRVGDQTVQFDGARVITSRAALELSGSAGFDGELDIRVSGEPLRVAGRKPTPVANRALAVSYQITGTLAEPRLTVSDAAPSTTSGTP